MKSTCQQHCFSTLNHNLAYCYNDARVIKWLWANAQEQISGRRAQFRRLKGEAHRARKKHDDAEHEDQTIFCRRCISCEDDVRHDRARLLMTRVFGEACEVSGCPATEATCVPHSRPPHSPPEQDRECCGHKHEIYPRAVQGEIHDSDKEQRKQRNSRHSGDSCYQLNSPVPQRSPYSGA